MPPGGGGRRYRDYELKGQVSRPLIWLFVSFAFALEEGGREGSRSRVRQAARTSLPAAHDVVSGKPASGRPVGISATVSGDMVGCFLPTPSAWPVSL